MTSLEYFLSSYRKNNLFYIPAQSQCPVKEVNKQSIEIVGTATLERARENKNLRLLYLMGSVGGFIQHDSVRVELLRL